MVEVLATDEFVQWYDNLNDGDAQAVYRHVGLLEGKGVSLDFPYSSAIKGARYAIRELRIKARGKPIRVFYVFDPKKNAVLLLGGHKAGNKRFYDQYVPRSEKIREEYLAELASGGSDGP